MILNVMEHHVVEAYDRLKGKMAGFDETPEHREDVIVYALNRLPPKYVVTDAGKAVGGEFRMSQRFGPYFLWPDSVEV